MRVSRGWCDRVYDAVASTGGPSTALTTLYMSRFTLIKRRLLHFDPSSAFRALMNLHSGRKAASLGRPATEWRLQVYQNGLYIA